MNTLKQALLQSIIIQALITLTVTGVASYLWATQAPVPDTLMVLLGAAWGFYFRSKAANEVRSNILRDTQIHTQTSLQI